MRTARAIAVTLLVQSLLALPLLALAAATLAPPSAADPTTTAPRTTLPAVEAQVMCVTCKIPLTTAESPQAARERIFIQGLIDQGQTLTQIKRALVFQYGPAVLALPASHGFDLTVYVVPAAVLLALLATVAVLLPRWRRRARATQAARAAEGVSSPADLSSADAARLQADMAHFD